VGTTSLQDAKGNKDISSSALSCHVNNKVVDVELFHAHLVYSSVSKLNHIDFCRPCSRNYLYYDTCVLSKFHGLPFSRSESMASQPFELVHVASLSWMTALELHGLSCCKTNCKCFLVLNILLHMSILNSDGLFRV